MNGNATKNYVSRHSSGGGGGGGTTNYNELSNKPKINGVELSGNKTSEDLHITGGGGINFDNLTLVKENFGSWDSVDNVTVINGIAVKVYAHYNDGDTYIDFYILPKQLINLVANGKDIVHAFNSNASVTIRHSSHSGNVYNFQLNNQQTSMRMDLYTF